MQRRDSVWLERGWFYDEDAVRSDGAVAIVLFDGRGHCRRSACRVQMGCHLSLAGRVHSSMHTRLGLLGMSQSTSSMIT